MTSTWNGPWTRGHTLDTRVTRSFSAAAREENDRRERRTIYSNFHAKDQGRSRILVAVFEREEDAVIGALAPDALDLLAKSLPYIEDAANDPVYKADVVKRHAAAIRGVLAQVVKP